MPRLRVHARRVLLVNVVAVSVVVRPVPVVGPPRGALICRSGHLLTHPVASKVVVSMMVLLVRVLASPAVYVMSEVTAQVSYCPACHNRPSSLPGGQIRYIVVLRAGIGGRVVVTRHPRHVFCFTARLTMALLLFLVFW